MDLPRRSHGLAFFAVALVGMRLTVPLVLLHPAWEFHRDELLYFAMADHFAPFAMQFPPFIAAVAKTSGALFGDAVWAARVPAALGGAALLAVLLGLVLRIGGGMWSLMLTALATLAAPVLLRSSVLMQPVIFDQLWAALAVAALVLAAYEREPRWWLLIGIALGLGGLTKFSAAFYAACVGGTAIVLPMLRSQLRTRWPWIAAGLALLIVSPSLTGQFAHDWPFLAQMRTLREQQLAAVTVRAFLLEQPQLLGGATLVVCAGILAAIRGDVAARTSATFGGMLGLLMLVSDGKSYYAAPAYPVLLACGGVWLERTLQTMRAQPARRRLVSVGAPVSIFVCALVLLPMGVPMFAPAQLSRYAVSLGAVAPPDADNELPLPQDYADMLGWRAQAAAAAAAIESLPVEERSQVLLVGSNYGRAGALAMYRKRFALPYPVSVNGDFHAWGTYGNSGSITMMVAEPDALPSLQALFASVIEVGRLREPRAVAEERDVRVYMARGPVTPLDSMWPRLGPRWD